MEITFQLAQGEVAEMEKVVDHVQQGVTQMEILAVPLGHIYFLQYRYVQLSGLVTDVMIYLVHTEMSAVVGPVSMDVHHPARLAAALVVVGNPHQHLLQRHRVHFRALERKLLAGMMGVPVVGVVRAEPRVVVPAQRILQQEKQRGILHLRV
jgi:hypothetical protein